MSLGRQGGTRRRVRGAYSRWLLFPDATVEVGEKVFVKCVTVTCPSQDNSREEAS